LSRKKRHRVLLGCLLNLVSPINIWLDQIFRLRPRPFMQTLPPSAGRSAMALLGAALLWLSNPANAAAQPGW
jgi:hypothetical protein